LDDLWRVQLYLCRYVYFTTSTCVIDGGTKGTGISIFGLTGTVSHFLG